MIPKTEHILYVSDMEEGSRPAFRAAVSIAQAYNAQITFLHVVEPLHANALNMVKNILNRDELKQWHDEGLGHIRQTMQQRIERFCQSEFEATQPQLTTDALNYKVAEGVIWEEILHTAKAVNADLIVMGSRRHHKFNTLGSTAHKVLHHSHCPVHIVPL